MKTTKFLLAVLAMGAMVACSKSDDLQLSETQGMEMDNPVATNLKASTIQQSTLKATSSTLQFKVHTYVTSGSYRDTNSNLYIEVNFKTRFGNTTVTLPLATTGNDEANGGNSDYVAQVGFFSPPSGNYISIESASVFFEGNGLIKLHYLSIDMQAPDGNSKITGSTSLVPSNPYGLADLGSRGMNEYDTGNIGEGRISSKQIIYREVPPIVYEK